MTMQSVNIQLPDNLYRRLEKMAGATKRPLEDIIVQAVRVGSPPSWEDAPAEFQADLAALDRLEDDALWQVARGRVTAEEMVRYDELLYKNANEQISPAEKMELGQLRTEADRFMLRKAQAAVILRWRGYPIPPADKL